MTIHSSVGRSPWLMLFVLVMSGCAFFGGKAEPDTAEHTPVVDDVEQGCEAVDRLRVQVPGQIRARFAGYHAAIEEGMFADHCLDVQIVATTDAQDLDRPLVTGDVDVAVASAVSGLRARQSGAHVVNIAQVFRRSGELLVSTAEHPVSTLDELAGTKIGHWGGAREPVLRGVLGGVGLNPDEDVELSAITSNMVVLIEGDVQLAQATIYNEFAELLTTTDQQRDVVFSASDFTALSLDALGYGMLEDGLWVDADRLDSDVAYRDAMIRFVAAMIEGWAYCRDNVAACATMVAEAGAPGGPSRQLWEMNEVNKLIWPAPDGMGYLDLDAWRRTIELAEAAPLGKDTYVLSDTRWRAGYDVEVIEAAHRLVDVDLDVKAEDYTAQAVELGRTRSGD